MSLPSPSTTTTLSVSRSSSDDASTTPLLLALRHTTTARLITYPYDLVAYLRRAALHAELSYPDLAAGDAYRALLLCDECRDGGGVYTERARETLWASCRAEGAADGGAEGEVSDGRGRRQAGIPRILRENRGADVARVSTDLSQLPNYFGNMSVGNNGVGNVSDERIMDEALYLAQLQCYRRLGLNLLLCGCLKSAHEFCTRGLRMAPHDEELLQHKGYIEEMARKRLQVNEIDINNLPDQGLVRREVYPWNDREPDRFSVETLDHLNSQLARVAPKVEVKVTELPVLGAQSTPQMETTKQLGLFAKEAIYPGEIVLDEYTILAANCLLKESLCDACSTIFPAITAESTVVPCPNCEDNMFCNTFCLEQAQNLYHSSVCDTDVDTIAKDPEPHEITEALYLNLLGRSFAMSAVQNLHPLDLKEVKYIWGDFLPTSANAIPSSPNAPPPPTWTLPFSFKYNISGPLHFLEHMDIDIYASLGTYDLWILNTLYAKFRGTASARVNPHHGKPEVAAVHPLWCLANHDCDPNVQWEWGGRMKLWCRETRISGARVGIARGEEILNHYCDVELDVQQRREWMMGSLGGMCACGRCRREDAVQDGHHEEALVGVPGVGPQDR